MTLCWTEGKNLSRINFTGMAAPALNPNKRAGERICLSKWKETIFSFRFLEVIKLKDAVESKIQGVVTTKTLLKKCK